MDEDFACRIGSLDDDDRQDDLDDDGYHDDDRPTGSSRPGKSTATVGLTTLTTSGGEGHITVGPTTTGFRSKSAAMTKTTMTTTTATAAAMQKVPITNDGMGVCIRCGNIGVKDTFYGKGKQYCSANCVRGLPPSQGTGSAPVFKIMSIAAATGQKTPKIVPKTQSPMPLTGQTSNVQVVQKKKMPASKSVAGSVLTATPVTVTTGSAKKNQSGKNLAAFKSQAQTSTSSSTVYSFDWTQILTDVSIQGAPVSSFPHAPMSEVWDSIVTIGLKLEVKNRDYPALLSKTNQELHWIASVVKIAGYMVLLRYEGFGNDSSKDFWVNIFNNQVHPVGWCASQGKALIPPKTIEERCPDWKDYLVKRLTGSRTLPHNFQEQVKEALKSRFKIGMKLEVVDKNRISAVRVATIDELIGGRLHVQYEGADENDEGFWCHQRSPIIHPVGWAQVIGHELRATQEYARSSLQKSLNKQYNDDDATWNLFNLPSAVLPSSQRFAEGMKLEAIDPLNLSTICVATVTKVLRNNYLMIGIDGMMAPNGSDWFCYHAASPCIFPVGFCSLNNIQLTPPRGYSKEFTWFQYLRELKATAAPVMLFKKDIPKHGFKEGMYIEAVDLMEPRLICVATITKVVGRLLRVHFVGWDDSYDQWCDCESPELFPIGWCHMVGYPLEPPKDDESSAQNQTPNSDSKRKRNTYKTSRSAKKKKRASGPSPSEKESTYEGQSWNEWRTCQDQTVSSTSNTSNNNNSNNASSSFVAASVDCNSSVVVKPSPIVQSPADAAGRPLDPRLWSADDVAEFLRSNDCGAYSDAFLSQNIEGQRFLSMSREDVIGVTHILGPSLKIFALIQTLAGAKK